MLLADDADPGDEDAGAFRQRVFLPVADVRALLLVLGACATVKAPPALPRESWPNLPLCIETCPTGKLARPFEATIRFLLNDSATLAACCMETP